MKREFVCVNPAESNVPWSNSISSSRIGVMAGIFLLLLSAPLLVFVGLCLFRLLSIVPCLAAGPLSTKYSGMTKETCSLFMVLTGLRVLVRYVHPDDKTIAKLVRMVDGSVEQQVAACDRETIW